MSVSDEFLEFVVDQLSSWGGVTARKMFGGAGLYRDGKMFGLIADDVAYLKVDDSNRPEFVAAAAALSSRTRRRVPACRTTKFLPRCWRTGWNSRLGRSGHWKFRRNENNGGAFVAQPLPDRVRRSVRVTVRACNRRNRMAW